MTDAQKQLEDTLEKAQEKYPEITALDEVDATPIIAPIPVSKKNKEDIESDYEFSREKYYDLIKKGQDAIDELMFFASDSQEPDTYEVIGKLIKTTSEVTKELLALQKTVKEIDEENTRGKNVTNNSIYVGSTTDLQKLIKNSQKENGNSK